MTMKSASTHTYKNPILPGFHPDPSICRKGGDFYLTNSTFEYFPGLPIYHSRDLIHWELITNALNRDSQLDLWKAPSCAGLFAPTIRYWNGLFYLTCTNVSGQGNFIVTAQDPAGPWSEPMWMDDREMDGSMLFDDNGKAFFTRHAGGEHGGIDQAEFDPRTGKLTTPFKRIWTDAKEVWNEGPHLYKIRGKYYLCVAEGGTGFGHMEAVGRSNSPFGPFEPAPAPLLTARDHPENPAQCAGHADLIDAPDGTWWLVFLATRSTGKRSVLGRETFLAPVEWTRDGWPELAGGNPPRLEYPVPALKAFKVPAVPQRRLFNTPELGPAWLNLRNPLPGSFSLAERKGWLRLWGQAAGLDEVGSPAFAGIRQESFTESWEAELEFKPEADGEEAGLCLRANQDNYAAVGIWRESGETTVFARARRNGAGRILEYQAISKGKVFLRIQAAPEEYRLAFSLNGKTWEILGRVSSGDLGQDLDGAGFIGAVFGLYATGNGQASKAPADFGWAEKKP
jgi:alpha-N-arabinofuranosidase